MRRILLISLIWIIPLYAVPQSVVTDPTSMAQRIALFLQQMEEVVSQSLDISETMDNTSNLLKLSEKSAEYLQKVSQYIKTSRQLVSITEAELRVAQKIEKYSKLLNDMDDMTPTEKANAIRSIVMLGAAAIERISNALQMVNGESGAKMSDYERLQLLTTIENEVLALESSMDDAYEGAVSTHSVECVMDEIMNLSMKAITFDF